MFRLRRTCCPRCVKLPEHWSQKSVAYGWTHREPRCRMKATTQSERSLEDRRRKNDGDGRPRPEAAKATSHDGTRHSEQVRILIVKFDALALMRDT
jgi:hypothetical protein